MNETARGLEGWRGWHAANPCPQCGGFAGYSGEGDPRCTGGAFPDKQGRFDVLWCSVDTRGAPSSSGRTYRFRVTRGGPLVYLKPERQRRASSSGEGVERPSSTGWSTFPPGVDADRFAPSHVYTYRHPIRERWETFPPALFYVFRFEEIPEHRTPGRKRLKEIRPARRHRSGVGYVAGYGGDLVPYRLPELRAGIARGGRVYLVEGEKAAEAGWRLAFPEPEPDRSGVVHFWHDYPDTAPAVFTTFPGGLIGARTALAQQGAARYFEGLDTLDVIVDRDANGAGDALRDLVREFIEAPGIVRSVRYWRTPIDAPGADLADHVEHGLTLSDLIPS